MKHCKRCNETKNNTEFGFKNKEKGWLQAYCRLCNKTYQKEHYDNNKQDYIDKAAVANKRYRTATYKWIKSYVLENPCVDCGNNDFRVAHFDHVDRTTKSYEISLGISKKYSIAKLQKEIDKCVVRCANCHSIRTAKQLGYYKDV